MHTPPFVTLAVFSLALCLFALHLVRSRASQERDKRWAFASLGVLLGTWLGVLLAR